MTTTDELATANLCAVEDVATWCVEVGANNVFTSGL
jgi:dTDP-4-dehydrorhamnose reductase